MILADFWGDYRIDMEKRLRKATMKQKGYVMNDKLLLYFYTASLNEITATWQT